MDEAERTHVLQRKARSGREEHQARVMTPPRALRLSLARVADELFGLPLSVSSIHVGETGQDGTVAGFADDHLIVVLDGPEGSIGAVSVDLAVLSGLIEMQTTGHVVPRDPDPRMPTQTDAALVAPLIDGMLAGFAENLSEAPETGWARGFRFGAMIEETRLLGLLLEALDFHVFRLQVDLGGGARSGEIMLALPVVAAPQADCPDPGAGAVAERATGAGGCSLRLGQGALMDAEACLTAVLHRIRLPLAEIGALRPGDVLHIPRTALAETRLETGTERNGIACRLGQINGHRAVRLNAGAGGAAAAAADADAMSWPQPPTMPEPRRSEPAQIAAAIGATEEAPDPDRERTQAGGAAVTGQRDHHADPAAPNSLPEDLHATEAAAGVGNESAPVLPGAPDLPDLSDPGDLGDVSDLPELALDA
ncbi:FliM/FliN family flagellar motor C-terminal domain-containing protein [Marimonas arenosa]|uniref:FliM/FliN family flagellar motor C-terminal domain-containing protein n=1 Tax=Marimonas arenosa TaxID=1795305 RepID=A0AAE4B7D8_9RHOB|nr:FliM/FliN family flagellar motor C-terminal domain-containing protein [Marimonas arenosa]MDQ2091386.1 FliM/FliN family flagellar motor C-terminal domain-containing protein [Marimonas arenosa]